MSREGIEIHFDEKRGHLELACEPEAFAPYREIARKQLRDFPEIALDKVVEINIVDTATFVVRRNAPRKRFEKIAFALVIIVTLALAVIGAFALFTRLTT